MLEQKKMDYAAIKACFAPGPMFASVPGLFAFVWGGWDAEILK